MKYPKFLKPNGTIGLFAPSFGANIDPYKTRLEHAILKLKAMGYQILVEGSIFGYFNGASSSPIERAQAFMSLYKKPQVDFLWSVGGGEWLLDMLPYIDFEDLKKYPPKFVMGYSDNTHLTLLMNTLLDTASIYGQHATEFGMTEWEESLKEAFEVMTGKRDTQTSYAYHEAKDANQIDPLGKYVLTEKTVWKNLNGEAEIRLSGRFIGGCLDVFLAHLGTPFEHVPEFLERYKDEGIVWFIEACDLNLFAYKRALWQLKHAGWFKHTKGIIFGRHLNTGPIIDLNQYDVTKDILIDLNIPIIMDADFGHIAPTFTLISGAFVEILSKDGKGFIKTLLK
ncbi:LD-carboxypeptidase [Acholeplasma vituli]|uniref:LD-carboxypeptidase n=1 Tax=Paracholeplasma vituli TaxID=69473 RepID=A0ABT2PWX4_9MOLU|nr:S66 peptidase family protein [Paracholeplasma vituli]MCU0105460.1 LD-carboxypeptidase [Paracholeplasma vituli]